MTNDLDALSTALYVESDEETGGTRWLRFVDSRSGGMFPYAPEQPGWNERLRATSSLVEKTARILAAHTDFRFDNHAPAPRRGRRGTGVRARAGPGLESPPGRRSTVAG
ncbi:hypothetical protein [Streptomyces roseolilacinus]|uniref:hypothetical protein n=1 Tax=Streptomyces roseolilacinus TaxID=66904 RepID=UPI0037FA9E81